MTEALHVKKMAFHPTSMCNLKCKLCQTYAPYRKPWYPDLDTVKLYLDKLFELVPFTDQFCYSGGEPLLRKDTAKIFDYIYENYNDSICKEFMLITNGSIMPPDDFFESLNRFGKKVTVIVDFYGEKLSPNAHKLYDRLLSDDGNYELRDQTEGKYFGGWVDFNDLSLRYTPEQAFEKWGLCKNANSWKTFTLGANGIIAPCERIKWAMENEIPALPDEYVDIFDKITSLEQKRKIIKSWYSKPFSTCMRCDGLIPESPRHPAAEQIESEK